MLVRTQQQRFAVVRVLRETPEEEISLCRELTENGGLYTLARFRNPDICRLMLPTLARQRDNVAFSDYLGLFTQEGDLYARFRYTDAPTLTQRLEAGKWSLPERLEVGGNLLERMTLQNMPGFLQYEALREQNITVDDALCVRFNYLLEPLSIGFAVDMSLICIRVEELLRELFAPELAAKSAPELEEFLARLAACGCATYLEIYSGYDRVRTQLQQRVLTGQVEPQTWLFRLWRRIKGATRFVRPLLAGLVVVAAFCYLLYTVFLPPIPKGTPVRFDQVGTVVLQKEDGVNSAR